MADFESLTVEILEQIREELRGTNARIDQTNTRLDQTRVELGARIDQTNTRLDQHERLLLRLAEESQVHTQALKNLIGRVDVLNVRVDNLLVGPMGAAVRDHDARLEALEADVASLKRRAG